MKKVILFVFAMAVCSAASAQFSLGGLVKKATKAVTETVTDAANDVVNQTATDLGLTSGITNPFMDVWRIDSIKAYGVKTSNNFGTVWLVINAEAIVPLKYGNVQLGGSMNKTYAVIGGKTYKPYEDQTRSFDMPEGVPMELDTKGVRAVAVENVPASATTIQAYNMYIYIDPSRHNTTLWKNIPINWQE